MSETDPYKDGYAAAERFHVKRAATLLAEINTLATTLEARSEALNRVAAENEALRARLARVEALADWWRRLGAATDDGNAYGIACHNHAKRIRAALADQEAP